MGKPLGIIFMFYSLAIAIAIPGTYSSDNVIALPGSHSRADQEPDPVKEWFQNLNQEKGKVTKLHFYVQDVVSGENQTVWKVAESKITAASPSSFGLIYMADNLLTDGPEPDSKIVGRAQGMIAFADLHDIAIYMVVNIVFTEGKYSGSTISILGRNLLSEEERELPIVGGTGVFRMARGIAVTSTRSSFDENNKSYEVLEYTLYVRYY